MKSPGFWPGLLSLLSIANGGELMRSVDVFVIQWVTGVWGLTGGDLPLQRVAPWGKGFEGMGEGWRFRGPSTAQLAKCASCFAQDDGKKTCNSNSNRTAGTTLFRGPLAGIIASAAGGGEALWGKGFEGMGEGWGVGVLRLRNSQSARVASLRMTAKACNSTAGRLSFGDTLAGIIASAASGGEALWGERV